MSRNHLWSRLFVLVLALAATAQIEASAARGAFAYGFGPATSVSFFYDDLAPYGHWIDLPGYGWCWSPDVPADWRPYRYGRWLYSDAGWAWDSDEPWGWAVFHYGTWLDDPVDGWVWVPGTVWAPAWVAWRDDDDWIGWAPLEPGVTWSASFGLRGSSSFGDLPERSWCFVERRRFMDRDAGARAVATWRNREIVGRTRLHADYPASEGRPFDRGIELAGVERAIGHPVQRTRIMDARSPVRGNAPRLGAGTAGFYRPVIEPLTRADRAVPPRTRVDPRAERRGAPAGTAVPPRPEPRTPAPARRGDLAWSRGERGPAPMPVARPEPPRHAWPGPRAEAPREGRGPGDGAAPTARAGRAEPQRPQPRQWRAPDRTPPPRDDRKDRKQESGHGGGGHNR